MLWFFINIDAAECFILDEVTLLQACVFVEDAIHVCHFILATSYTKAAQLWKLFLLLVATCLNLHMFIMKFVLCLLYYYRVCCSTDQFTTE